MTYYLGLSLIHIFWVSLVLRSSEIIRFGMVHSSMILSSVSINVCICSGVPMVMRSQFWMLSLIHILWDCINDDFDADPLAAVEAYFAEVEKVAALKPVFTSSRQSFAFAACRALRAAAL